MNTRNAAMEEARIRTQAALVQAQAAIIQIQAEGKDYDAPWLKNGGKVTRDASGRFYSSESDGATSPAEASEAKKK